MTRPRSRFEASRWHSWANSFERRLSCEELRAPSVRKRRWPARGASSPRPRSRSSRGTWLAGTLARRGEGDAGSTWRPRQRRTRPVSRDTAPPPNRPHRRDRACARRARPLAPPTPIEDCPRAGGCGHRDASAPDEGGACCPRARRSRRTRCAYTCADGGSRTRIHCPRHARGTPDCERRGAPPAARGSRRAAGVEGARRRRVPSRRAARAHGDSLATQRSGSTAPRLVRMSARNSAGATFE